MELTFLLELALKTVFSDMNCTTKRAAEMLKLPMSIVESLLQNLYREKLVEVRGLVSFGNNRYAMLEHGWERVQRLLDLNGYIGPAPVSLDAYRAFVVEQARARVTVKPETVAAAMSGLVLPQSTLQTLGLVASSRRGLFMSGPSGNGKTSIAKSMHEAQGSEIWVPYALGVDGQIIKIFDPHNHKPVAADSANRYDQRWIKVKRPLVIVGGELTIETMDLIYSRSVRFYEAPFQLKSNGGTLIIDDFGRQRIDPRDLLNRWIIPLEGRVDYLTLHTGKKIEVPFEQLLIFATNLEPERLVDEAFLRRIGYRLEIAPPARQGYTEIFDRYIESAGFASDPECVDFLVKCHEAENWPLRGCEPRDLVDRCTDICEYEGRPKVVTRELLALAWQNYYGKPPAVMARPELP